MVEKEYVCKIRRGRVEELGAREIRREAMEWGLQGNGEGQNICSIDAIAFYGKLMNEIIVVGEKWMNDDVKKT